MRLGGGFVEPATRVLPSWRQPWTIIVALVLILQAVLALTHVPFVDEWQALQIAIQSPSLPALLENLRYEGHPPSWYLFLRGLGAVVGPYAALQTAAVVLGLFTQAAILSKSPFPKAVRLLLALSQFVLFEFNTISRGYTLGVALVFAALLSWNCRRLVWLFIGLLPFTEFFFGVFSVIFVWFRVQAKLTWGPGIVGWIAMSIISSWAVIPAHDFASVYPEATLDLQSSTRWLGGVSLLMFPFQGTTGAYWDAPPPRIAGLILWFPFLVLCWQETRGRTGSRVALFSFIAMTLAFHLLVHPLTNKHMMLIAILLIALQWFKAASNGHFTKGFYLWLIVAAIAGLWSAAVSFTRPFDTAPAVARDIKRLGLQNEPWAAFPTQHGQGVSALTGVMFERLGQGCLQDFVRWNAQRKFTNRADFESFLNHKLSRDGRFYLLTAEQLTFSENRKKVAEYPAGHNGKVYIIYEVGREMPSRRKQLPRCVPGMRPLGALPSLVDNIDL